MKKCGVSGRLPTVPENYRNRVLHGEMHGCAMRSTKPAVASVRSDVISLKC